MAAPLSETYTLAPDAPRPEPHPFAGLFPLMKPPELAELAASIRANGQIEPVVLHRGFVLDGRNRIAACLEAGVAVTCRDFAGSDRAALDYVIALNLDRRHLTPSQRAMVAAKLATLKVGDNQHSGAPVGQGRLALPGAADVPPGPAASSAKADGKSEGHEGGTSTAPGEPAQNCAGASPLPGPPPQAGEGEEPALVSQERAAAMMGVSRRSVQHAAAVQAGATPEVREAVTAGEIAVSTAAEIAAQAPERQAELLAALRGPDGKLTPEAKKVVAKAARELRREKQDEKKRKREERERALGEKQLALPDLQFGVILEDFEWDFEPFSRETGMDRHAANHYETAGDAHTPEEIVERTKHRFAVAAKDCAVFMWTTNPHLAIAIHVGELRGFKYVTNWVWTKDKIGPGYWNREQHELLLLFTRGKVPAPAMGEQTSSVLYGKRGKHSLKPEHGYQMIERFFPTMPKLELNARRARPGWHAWGNEAPAAGGTHPSVKPDQGLRRKKKRKRNRPNGIEAERGAAASPDAGRDTGGIRGGEDGSGRSSADAPASRAEAASTGAAADLGCDQAAAAPPIAAAFAGSEPGAEPTEAAE